MSTSKLTKRGTVILNFKDEPLHLEEFLKKETRHKLSATEKKRYEEIYDKIFYSGNGKSYTLEGQTKYFKNKPGFYVLELPYTCERNAKNYCDKDILGYKLGKAESNPTGAEAAIVSTHSGGLAGRLMSYFIELGKNVRILHLRVFASEDLNYYGNKRRANSYETAIKQVLAKRNKEPIRGGQGGEYFRNLEDIQSAIKRVDNYPDDDIRDIAPDEFEGQQIGANVITRSTNRVIKVKSRLIVLSEKYKTGRLKYGSERLTIMKKMKPDPENQFWDVIFDDQLKEGVKKATIHIEFHRDRYNKYEEGGWVFEDDKLMLPHFKNAPSETKFTKLDNVRIKKRFKNQYFYGTATYLGSSEKPPYVYQIKYDDGDREKMSYEEVKAHMI